MHDVGLLLSELKHIIGESGRCHYCGGLPQKHYVEYGMMARELFVLLANPENIEEEACVAKMFCMHLAAMGIYDKFSQTISRHFNSLSPQEILFYFGEFLRNARQMNMPEKLWDAISLHMAVARVGLWSDGLFVAVLFDEAIQQFLSISELYAISREDRFLLRIQQIGNTLYAPTAPIWRAVHDVSRREWFSGTAGL